MPRNGSGIYEQPFPNVTPDTEIESAVYNGFTRDVEFDLNATRPIIAGGTGAANATEAMFNLKGETAAQLVTNYDSHVWLPGSFRSAAGATGAPSANAFVGSAFINETLTNPPANQNVVVEARDMTNGKLYGRQKNAGVWSAWAVSGIGDFVELAGDTMTGDLTIAKTNPKLYLNKAASGQDASLIGTTGGSARWGISLGGITSEAGANVGSDFGITRYNDGGVAADSPLTINRATGAAAFLSMVTGAGITSAATATTGNYFFGNSGSKSLVYDGTNFSFSGGALITVGNVYSAPTATTGAFMFGSAGTRHLANDGTVYTLTGGALRIVTGGVFIVDQTSKIDWGLGTTIYRDTSDGAMSITAQNNILRAPGVYATGYGCKPGSGGAFVGNQFNINYTTGAQLWIDTTNLGTITVTSDYRIKKDVLDLPGMWDTVKALRPIKYTGAEFSPPSHLAHMTEAKDGASVGPLFTSDDIERWGFIAHELQETLVPSAATGEKDSPDTIQSPNPFTIIAALTKGLQEAMARIEALEARV
jgi:hypothetical protein